MWLLICDIVTLVQVIVCKIQQTHKRTYRIKRELKNVWLLICDIVTLVQVPVCKMQQTHTRTYSINKGTVEYLVVDM